MSPSVHGRRSVAALRGALGLTRGICVAAIWMIAGCSAVASRGDNSWLDSDSGLTLSTAEDVMVFARTESQYSLSARDYLYLGPVESNRQGLREYYLWVGVATTLDRGYLAPESDLPAALVVTVRNEPIEFNLRPWSELLPRADSRPIYPTQVMLEGQLGARVTLDQIRLLGDEQLAAIRVTDAAGRSRLYSAWGAATGGWGEFERAQ